VSVDYSSKTVLLTGAGGPAIAGMVSVLRQWGYRIVVIDMLPFASGFDLADRAYVLKFSRHEHPEGQPSRSLCSTRRAK
jgi:hypothetical protein